MSGLNKGEASTQASDGLYTYAFHSSLKHAFRLKIKLFQDRSCAMTAALLALALLFHASFGAPQNAKEGHLGASDQAGREVCEIDKNTIA